MNERLQRTRRPGKKQVRRQAKARSPRPETKRVDPLALTPRQEIAWSKLIEFEGAEEALDKLARRYKRHRTAAYLEADQKELVRYVEGEVQDFVSVLRSDLLKMPDYPVSKDLGLPSRYLTGSSDLVERKLPTSKQLKQAHRWVKKILSWDYRELKMPAWDLFHALRRYEGRPVKRSYPAHVELIHFVEKSTGRFCYNQLAILISAAHQARGNKGFYVTPDALKLTWRREGGRFGPMPPKPQTPEEIKTPEEINAMLVAKIRKLYAPQQVPPEIEELCARIRSPKPN